LGDFGYRGAMNVEGDSGKLKFSSFQGRNDPIAYLKWKKKVNWIFHWIFHSDVCSKKKNVKIVVIKFVDYVVIYGIKW